jgi:ADP-heptose:LPS heptosyltransferase
VSNQVLHGGADSPRTDRALAIFPGALGDLMCFLPALERFRRRRPVLLFCKQELARLIGASTLAEAAAIERRESSWIFSASPPAEAEDFYRGFSSVDSFSGFGVPEVESNLGRWLGAKGRVHPFAPSEPVHPALHYLRCLAPEPPLEEPPEVRLALRAEVLEDSRRRLANHVDLDGRALVLHPGSGGQRKRWSRAGFAKIAERWSRRGGRVVVLLGPAEQDEKAVFECRGVDVLSELDLVDVAVLLSIAGAYLGNDSGVSHLAAAMGARGLALFGPTDPVRWRPLSRRIETVRLRPWSSCEESAPLAIVDAVEDALVRSAGAGKAGVSP